MLFSELSCVLLHRMQMGKANIQDFATRRFIQCFNLDGVRELLFYMHFQMRWTFITYIHRVLLCNMQMHIKHVPKNALFLRRNSVLAVDQEHRSKHSVHKIPRHTNHNYKYFISYE